MKSESEQDHLARLDGFANMPFWRAWPEQLASLRWAVKTIRELQGRARPCTHGYHPVFVRANGSIVAHYHENRCVCPASETLYPEAPVDGRDKTIREQEDIYFTRYKQCSEDFQSLRQEFDKQAEEVKRLRSRVAELQQLARELIGPDALEEPKP